MVVVDIQKLSPVGWVERQRNPTNDTPKKAQLQKLTLQFVLG
ncbi:hypothetical protein [Nostoc sp. FACHB-280]|nr:hypothetical protein [Nostoc sp. FACHB-280]